MTTIRTSSSSSSPAVATTNFVVFILTTFVAPIYIGYRICMANRMPITDCDETYNYWEPVHYLLYEQHQPQPQSQQNDGTSSSSSSLLSFQTWEYSNQYALRTYAYLLPLVTIGRIYHRLLSLVPLSSLSFLWTLLAPHQQVATSNNIKVAVFILLRSTLGAWMVIGEISFCHALMIVGSTSYNNNNNNHKTATTTITPIAVGIVTLFLLGTSSGMGHSAGALLPSSTVMGLWLYASSAFLHHKQQRDIEFVILAIVATLAVGWPFGVIVFVPLGIAVLLRQATGTVTVTTTTSSSSFMLLPFLKFIMKIVGVTIVIQSIVMMIDYTHYQRIVSPVWNILMYNTKQGGDELYGVEPWTYYIKNLILNFNYVAVVGIFGPICIFGIMMIQRLLLSLLLSTSTSSTTSSTSQYYDNTYMTTTMIWLLLPMYLWLGIVTPRPHKEERFLFPIYPCICLGAAWTSVISVQYLWNIIIIPIFNTTDTKTPTKTSAQGNDDKDSKPGTGIGLKGLLFILSILWIPSAIISQCRSMALSKYYTAPLVVYSKISSILEEAKGQQPDDDDDDEQPFVICTCGEWYRYPSSFYIPNKSTSNPMISTSFAFAPSSFDGQLPQSFTVYGSGPLASTHFNDQNLPELGSVVDNADTSCDYMIDLSTSSDCIGQTSNDNNNDDNNNEIDDSRWKPIIEVPFLDAESTTNILHRTLYIPIFHEQGIERGDVQYANFVLYENIYRSRDRRRNGS